MTKRKKSFQVLLFFALSLPTLMQAQDQHDMTILFDYFDSTVTIYIDEDEIVILDDFSDNEETKKILDATVSIYEIKFEQRHLLKDFALIHKLHM